MSKENVIKFYEQLKADKASAEALKKAVAGASVEATLAFARERGFEFTLDDVKAANADALKELSPEQLERVNAAGAGALCCGLGVGWGGGSHSDCGQNVCWIVGIGAGVTWEED